MLEATGTPVARAFDFYVEHGEAKGADLSRPAMEDTGARMCAAWDGVLSDTARGRFALRPSGLCGWCPLARVCPRARVETDKARKAAMDALDPSDPRVAGTHAPYGKESDMDALGMMFGATPAPKNEHGFSPDPWQREALAAWGLDGTPAPTGGTRALNAHEGKPYEPSLTGDRLNLAGYGFTQLMMTVGTARRLAGGDPERMRAALLAIIDTEWRSARAAFGQGAPDVPGLDEGRPDPHALLAWLDTSLSRDVDRLLRPLLDDMTPPEGETDDAGRLADRIRAAGDTLDAMLALTRRMLD